MDYRQFLHRKVRGAWNTAVKLPLAFLVHLRDAFTRRSLVDGSHADVVVCMATYGRGLKGVNTAILSIGLGSFRPGRIVLTVNADDVVPEATLRLRSRGLEIIRGDRKWGPHNKYFPFLLSNIEFSGTLVTADDDVIYPRSWLGGLVRQNESSDDVRCYLAHTVKYSNGELAPYREWRSNVRRDHNPQFFLGHSGVAYSPRFVEALRREGEAFLACCPSADDIWLNRIALQGGFAVSLVHGFPRVFPAVPGSNKQALMGSNVLGGRNDVQLRMTLSKEDVEILLERTCAPIG